MAETRQLGLLQHISHVVVRVRGAGRATVSDAEIIAARAAVLLRGGVAATRVIPQLGRELPDVVALQQVAESVQRGVGVPTALAEGNDPEWRLLAAAWSLAQESGAPLSFALDQLTASFRSLRELRQRRTVLLAGPRATVRLVALLPVLAILLGTLIGFDPVGVLLTPAGTVMLGAGLFLLIFGVMWARNMTRRIEQDDSVAGLEFTLLGIALGGGAPVTTAMRKVADTVDGFNVEWVRFDSFCRGAALWNAIESAQDLGVPIGGLLKEESAGLRATAHSELEREAERLGIRILVPLGVCALPSFIVLGVLPVLFSMLGSALL